MGFELPSLSEVHAASPTARTAIFGRELSTATRKAVPRFASRVPIRQEVGVWRYIPQSPTTLTGAPTMPAESNSPNIPGAYRRQGFSGLKGHPEARQSPPVGGTGTDDDRPAAMPE